MRLQTYAAFPLPSRKYLICSFSDPFFLDDEEASTVEIVKGEKESTPWPGTLDQGTLSVQANKFSATDGNGPTPRKSENTVENNDSDWEWDGTIDEDAHLGLE